MLIVKIDRRGDDGYAPSLSVGFVYYCYKQFSFAAVVVFYLMHTVCLALYYCTPSLPLRYRPSLPVWFITQELEFNTTDDCVAFLTGVGVVLDPAHQVMDCKLTVPKLS